MTFSKPNRSAATVSSTRVDPAPVSGICVTCLDGCEGPCEIGRSALKGRESDLCVSHQGQSGMVAIRSFTPRLWCNRAWRSSLTRRCVSPSRCLCSPWVSSKAHSRLANSSARSFCTKPGTGWPSGANSATTSSHAHHSRRNGLNEQRPCFRTSAEDGTWPSSAMSR